MRSGQSFQQRFAHTVENQHRQPADRQREAEAASQGVGKLTQAQTVSAVTQVRHDGANQQRRKIEMLGAEASQRQHGSGMSEGESHGGSVASRIHQEVHARVNAF